MPTAINVKIEHDRGPFNGLAEVTGTVTDPTEAVLSGANVTLTNERTRAVITQTSGSAGEFVFAFVPPGVYTLHIERSGFKALTVAGITMSAGQQARGAAVELFNGASLAGWKPRRADKNNGWTARDGALVPDAATPAVARRPACNIALRGYWRAQGSIVMTSQPSGPMPVLTERLC